MYAIIQTGGKQYRVSEGDYLRVERLTGKPGDEIELEDVLLVGGEDGARLGAPFVRGVKVKATVVDQAKGDKIIVFKFKRRKMYRRKNGHRQLYTGLRIDRIDLGDAGSEKTARKAKPAKEPTTAAVESAAAPAPEKKKPVEAKPEKKPAPKKAPKIEGEKAAAPAPKKAAPSAESAPAGDEKKDEKSKESSVDPEE